MQNVALIILAVGLLVAVFALLKRKTESKTDDGAMKLLLEQMNELSRVVDRKIGETTKQVNESMKDQFRESSKLIRDVTQGLTKLDETNKQVISFADQLQNLQDILKNLLAPAQYQMQYVFGNGEIVDAVVFVKDKIIPIDSKFSLENYNRLIEAKDPIEKERLEKLFVN